MKKVLLLSLSLALGFSAFAQQRVIKNDVRKAEAKVEKSFAGKEAAAETASNFAPQSAQSVVTNRYQNMEYAETMWTHYDLQSNLFVANRMFQLPNGSVAVTATMSHQESNQSVSDRGTGYNFYNANEADWESAWLEQPEARLESFQTGWPSIAQWGANGEILLCHGGGHMNCFTRETAGEGEWQYMGTLPDYPEGYPYNEYPTWPRVVTCGDNHNVIIAVAALQHTISEDETDVRTVMFRSEDAVNWTVSYSPLEEYDYHINAFSADDYAMAANGHTVAILYTGQLTNSTWMFKSTDDGLTWNTTKIWEHPYEGRDYTIDEDHPAWGMEDTLFIPMNGAITIDNNGVAHVALNTHEIIHTLENESGYYTLFSGRTVDGIYYWNDTQEAPIQDTEHPEYIGTPLEEHFANPNPHHALRLWWPIPDDLHYVEMRPDSTKWIGMIPTYQDENGNWIQWDNNKLYHENDYYYKLYGASGHPALSCDPMGNLACAFSSPCMAGEESDPYYFRHVYVSYRNVDEGYWHQDEDDITDPQVMFQLWNSDNLFTISANNTVNPGEFWFGFQGDDHIGLWWGTGATQTDASVNTIYVMKVQADPEMVSIPEPEAINPMTTTRVYPNPATDMLNIEVNASQASEMSISVYNIMGQMVMNQNVNLTTGINTKPISTSNLTSGVYFVTVKANGFENTMKFIVK
ncbi:MAG: T9SS type A sorting domain-containing protein [Bacteroidales bacterium]|nr:T9SS type A sorting domain-containing protein [Bacteroidales bacterium]